MGFSARESPKVTLCPDSVKSGTGRRVPVHPQAGKVWELTAAAKPHTPVLHAGTLACANVHMHTHTPPPRYTSQLVDSWHKGKAQGVWDPEGL